MSKRDRDEDDTGLDEGGEGEMTVDVPPPTDESENGVLLDVSLQHHDEEKHGDDEDDPGDLDDERNVDDGTGMLSTAVEVLTGGGGVSSPHVTHQECETSSCPDCPPSPSHLEFSFR